MQMRWPYFFDSSGTVRPSTTKSSTCIVFMCGFLQMLHEFVSVARLGMAETPEHFALEGIQSLPKLRLPAEVLPVLLDALRTIASLAASSPGRPRKSNIRKDAPAMTPVPPVAKIHR